MYLGDFKKGATVRIYWNSFSLAGASITRSTNGTISVYEDGGTTQFTTGVTDTEDFDTLTGVHLIAIDTSQADYEAGKDYAVVLSAATIDGRTVNAVLAHFSIENRFVPGVPKKNVALNDVPFYMVSSTDHVTPATGLTITAQRSLDGGATWTSATGTVAEAQNGLYHFDASAADMNGTNVVLRFSATGADPALISIRTQ